MADEKRAAVIGLGSMGSGMAASLIAAGFDVTGCDPSEAARTRFGARAGRVVATPREAAAGASVVVCVVVNAQQSEMVLFGPDGCADALGAESVFVSCATLAPEAARGLSARLAEQDRAYLDAPISGGARRAAAGELTILVAGPAETRRRARPALEAMAQTIYELGEEVGPASAFKIVNQLLAGVHIAVASEAFAFAARQKLDLAKVYDVITNSAGNSWMFQDRMTHVLEGDYSPRSTVDIFVKDLGIVQDVARAAKMPVPLTALAFQLFTMTSAAGMGRDDDSSVARLYEQLSGEALFKSKP